MGILDRVQLDPGGEAEIIDFKTGRPTDAHERKLRRYAVLWWRATGTAPARVHAQYLEDSRTWTIKEGDLPGEETGLRDQVDRITEQLSSRPAPATIGAACRWCPVRARCDEGWTMAMEAARPEGRGDGELIICGVAGTHGILAKNAAGHEVAVVYAPAVAGQLPPLAPGRRVRVLDGVWRGSGKELEIKAWTEVYVLPVVVATTRAERSS
jgi:hypothetical protein